MRRRRFLIVLVLGIWIARGAGQGDKTALTLALETELDQFPARTSIYLKHLKTGEEAAVRADESFNSQSVIKVPIMVRAFQLAEEGNAQTRRARDVDARRPARRNRRVSVRRPRASRRPCAISSSR